MDVLRHCVVDISRFQEAVWSVERGSFRPGDALMALDRAKDDDLTQQLAGAVDLANAVDVFLRDMDALENPRPASSWFALKDALHAFRGGQYEASPAPPRKER